MSARRFVVTRTGALRDVETGHRAAKVYRGADGWGVQHHRGTGLGWDVVVTGQARRADAVAAYVAWLAAR